MADAKYKIIEKEEQDINTEQEEDDDDDDEDEEYEYTGNFDDDDTVTIITSSNHESHSIYSNKTNDEDIMRTPAAILALILVYYAFSIGLTFYQRKLLKVSAILHRFHFVSFWHQSTDNFIMEKRFFRNFSRFRIFIFLFQ